MGFLWPSLGIPYTKIEKKAKIDGNNKKD